MVPFAQTESTMAMDAVHNTLGGWDIGNVAEVCGVTDVCHGSTDPVKHNMMHSLHQVIEVM
jgi:hypothetical protein